MKQIDKDIEWQIENGQCLLGIYITYIQTYTCMHVVYGYIVAEMFAVWLPEITNFYHNVHQNVNVLPRQLFHFYIQLNRQKKKSKAKVVRGRERESVGGRRESFS